MPEGTTSVTDEVTNAVKKESTHSDNLIDADPNNIENGVSSTISDKNSPDKSEAETLLAQGKRHLYVKDFPNAVATLGDACAKLSEMYGDVSDECADAYFSYGRALLELAREESTGLDPNALGSESEKDNSDEEEEEGASEDKIKKENDQVEEQKSSPALEETINTIVEENNDEEEKEANEEDVDNLQLAWEVLELAKNIYERQHQDAKLAETYLYLGEVALESESYSNAVEDMKRCVEIQKRINAPDREIAETYFQLGIACSLSNEFDEAIENFKSSREILEKRIKHLKNTGVPSEDARNPFYSVEKEISEIKEILPEIQAKIADMEDSKQNTIKSVMAVVTNKFSDSAGPSSSSSVPVANGNTSKPATDISHLVRKKRKPEDELSSDVSVKKSCTSEAKK